MSTARGLLVCSFVWLVGSVNPCRAESPWMVIEVGGCDFRTWHRWLDRARDVARRLAPHARVVPVPVHPDEPQNGPLRFIVNGFEVRPPGVGWADPDAPGAIRPLERVVLRETGSARPR